jgi:GT2 family glycosyltransferase
MPLPYFSIIIPTHGRKAPLQTCLQALKQLDYPSDCLEVIIVFDGDDVQSLPDIDPLSVHILSQPHQGPAAARNLGAGVAGGSYLAFIDDDCYPSADWLLQLSAVLDNSPQSMVGGKIQNALPDNPYATASQMLVDYLYQKHNSRPSQSTFLTSNNMALPRSTFLELGGFDSRFKLAAGEDREFCRRWLKERYNIHYQPRAQVYHAHILTLSSFWRQHVNYGRGAFTFHQKEEHPHQPKLNGVSFYVNLILFPLRQAKADKLKLFLLFCLMQLATTSGFLIEYWASRNR